MKNYSTEIVEVIKNHLEKEDMQLVAFDEENGIFGFHMHIPGQICFVNYSIYVHDDGYTVLGRCPVRPSGGDEDAIRAVGEFVHRANHGLRNGNIELDYDDGELRYKTFVDCDGALPSDEVIRDSITIPASMLTRYSSGIIDVLYRGKDPKTAVKECENETKNRQELRRMLAERLQRFMDSHSGASDEDEDEDEDDDVFDVEDEDAAGEDTEEGASHEDASPDLQTALEALRRMLGIQDDESGEDSDT